ncbi:hypothetical protein [Nocardioides montaniterrae]
MGEQMETTPLAGNDRGEGWHRGLRRTTVLRWVGPGLAVVFLGAGLSSDARGHGSGYACLLVACLCALAYWMGYAGSAEPHDHEGRFGSGLALPLRPLSWQTCVLLGVLGLALVALPAAVALRWSQIEGRAGAVVGSTFGALVGLLLLTGAYAGIRQRLRKDRAILLTADGVVISSDRRPVRVPWHAITAVRPHWTCRRSGHLRSEDIVHNWLTLEADPALVEGHTGVSALAGTPSPTVDIEALACDPDLVLRVLRFYLENPEERGELRSVVAVDRVRSLAAGSTTK